METLIAWILAFITTQAPPTRPTYYPEAKETPEEALVRYQGIAEGIKDVVYDPDEAPLFKGPDGRARTAAVVESIMSHESFFRKDVDFGLGKSGVGDGGKSWCLMQVQLGKMVNGHTERRIVTLPNGSWRYAKDKEEGWGGEDLVADRTKCIRAGLHIVRVSFLACAALPVKQWLDVYASGTCDQGQAESEHRMGLAINWFASHRPTFHDADIHWEPPSATTMLDPASPAVILTSMQSGHVAENTTLQRE